MFFPAEAGQGGHVRQMVRPAQGVQRPIEEVSVKTLRKLPMPAFVHFQETHGPTVGRPGQAAAQGLFPELVEFVPVPEQADKPPEQGVAVQSHVPIAQPESQGQPAEHSGLEEGSGGPALAGQAHAIGETDVRHGHNGGVRIVIKARGQALEHFRGEYPRRGQVQNIVPSGFQGIEQPMEMFGHKAAGFGVGVGNIEENAFDPVVWPEWAGDPTGSRNRASAHSRAGRAASSASWRSSRGRPASHSNSTRQTSSTTPPATRTRAARRLFLSTGALRRFVPC